MDHITVLTQEAVDGLALKKSSIVVDATLGAGGHAREITSRLDERGTFVGVDVDEESIAGSRELEELPPSVHLSLGNFRDITSILEKLSLTRVDAILADLGWRMEQFSGNGKGFSFSLNEPLIMTYGDPEDYPFVAVDIVNEWDEEDIRNVLKGYGEERFAGRIARAIVEARTHTAITHSDQLADIVRQAVPGFYRTGKIHPATKTFQALRITVNDELEALVEFIEKSVALLSPEGRLAIITFHSLEDRIVKHTFRDYAKRDIGQVLTKKPMSATDEERKLNPRARSAKLRIFEKK